MTFNTKLIQIYFDIAYNRVYDFLTARLNRYKLLQELCINKQTFRDNDKILCVGIGTGNELIRILQINDTVRITGVDYSATALKKARKKALKFSKEITLLGMDAHFLKFEAKSFDKVICIHVTDFVEDINKVTLEIFRVLKKGGEFVITYPMAKEGTKLASNLLKDFIRNNRVSGKGFIRAFLETIVYTTMGIIYLPLLLRPNKKQYSQSEIKTMLTGLADILQIEEEPVYQDYIVYGIK